MADVTSLTGAVWMPPAPTRRELIAAAMVELGRVFRRLLDQVRAFARVLGAHLRRVGDAIIAFLDRVDPRRRRGRVRRMHRMYHQRHRGHW